MSDGIFHPQPEQLEALAAGELAGGDAAVVESHLLDCTACRGAVEDWRALFGALAQLPQPAPRPGFADAVMARVQVRQPIAARVWSLLERLVPRTGRAWGLLAAALALPTLGFTGLLAWIVAQPWLTVQGLLDFGVRQLGAAIASLPGRGLGLVADTTLGVWVTEALQWLSAVNPGSIGAAAAVLATMLVVSSWVIYQNLFRTETRSSGYANYCF